jgi:hypothetical protein
MGVIRKGVSKKLPSAKPPSIKPPKPKKKTMVKRDGPSPVGLFSGGGSCGAKR